MRRIIRKGLFISGLLVIVGLIFVNQVIDWTNQSRVGKTEEATSEIFALSANQSQEKTETLVQIGSQDVQLYSEPTASSQMLAEVNRGELATLVAVSDLFYQVITNEGVNGYIAKTDATLMEHAIKEVPSSLKEATIVLNPGHGGTDTGALSTDESVYEKEVTLATAKAIKTALEAHGSTVILTRETDATEELAEVVATSETNQADIFISLHYDSSENSNEATGTTTYYYYEAYADLAETINNQLEAALPLANRGVEYGNFQVLRENTQPALLFELGYMNTESDLATFNTESYREKVAQALVDGLTEYFQATTL